MRILLVNNSQERCGVAQYGRDLRDSLRRRGHRVDMWLADLSLAPYTDRSMYDVVLVNWMAGTIPHVNPDHFPGMKTACFFHESYSTNNRSRCPFWDTADAMFVPSPAEPEGRTKPTVYVPQPCPDERSPLEFFPWPGGVWLGNSSIRREGVDMLKVIASRNDWNVWTGEGLDWAPRQEEVNRLTRNHLNVYLYYGGHGGQATATMTAVAARRPIVLTKGRLHETLFDYEDELYFAQPGDEATIELTIRQVLKDIENGCEKRPIKLAEQRSWSKAAEIYERTLLEIVR